jgi:alpha-L-rhamnosidase
MVSQMAEPLRVTATLKPITVAKVGSNSYVYDMGQNMGGWVRLRVSGPAGTRVMLSHAESALPDGNLYMDNLRSARATDLYTLKGAGAEVWEPRFTYHGFRFVEVTGYPGTPGTGAIEGRVVHDNMTRAGEWTSSNPLLNQLHKNIFWGVRGNYRGIPTDCPQRDERQGWLGDRSVVSRGESYLHDVAAFYGKWTTDIADAQKPTGSVPDVAPAFWTVYSDNMTWPGTFVLIPGMLYDQYGDVRVIERNYPAMKKWLEYMRTKYSKDDLITKDTYGDWCVPPESPELIHSKDPARRTDGTLLSTASYIDMLRLMSRYATLIGRKQDVPEYEALAARMRAAFEKKFFNAEKSQYDNGTQTSSVVPLAFGLTPGEHRKAVFDRLTRKIESESNNHVGVGLVGAQWLMRTLSENGRPDLAYTIATQTS